MSTNQTQDTKQTASQAWIELNADFNKAVIIPAGELEYSPTPMQGVRRMMFERVGDEVARRATSCVTYEAGSSFKAHKHPGGEEYLVLSGTFSDQRGDFSKGWYVRNPLNSSHAPFTHEGCEIFVKLSQVPDEEAEYLELDTNTAEWQQVSANESRLMLWQSEYEHTSLHRVTKGYRHRFQALDVLELFVVEGAVRVDGKLLKDHSWLRLPPESIVLVEAEESAQFYLKIGRGAVRF